MDTFALYFSIGKEHILDYANGYDHILFVMALCIAYLLRDWRRVLAIVTSFTIGHSITLALATLKIIDISPQLVEFFIPVTIFITACNHIFSKDEEAGRGLLKINYLIALLFGLIHGMGFATYLQVALGKSQSIIFQLFAFNLGLEFGQLVIVLFFMGTSYLLVEIIGIHRVRWKLVVSSGIAGAALVLIRENVFW